MGIAKSLICGRRISIKSTKSWSRVFTHNLWKPVEVLEAILISPQQTFCHIPWQLETSVPIAMKALKMIPCWKSISRITTRAFSREALEFVLRDPKYVDWLNKTTSVTEGRNTITMTQIQESNKLLAEKLNSENKYTMVKECNGISEMKKNHITTQNDGTIKISVIKEQFINVTSIKRALSNEEWWINLINFPIESESGLNEINIVTLLSKIKVCADFW